MKIYTHAHNKHPVSSTHTQQTLSFTKTHVDKQTHTHKLYFCAAPHTYIHVHTQTQTKKMMQHFRCYMLQLSLTAVAGPPKHNKNAARQKCGLTHDQLLTSVVTK